MLVDLPAVWIVVLNFTIIPGVQIGLSWIFTRAPRTWFEPEGAVFRERAWEGGGRLYERWFVIRSWKNLLPDGAPWVGGFPKKSLLARDCDYLRDFRVETCRGEAAHLAQIPGVLITLLWNPWPVASGVILAWAIMSNLPCVVAQRHTRLRLNRLLASLEGKR